MPKARSATNRRSSQDSLLSPAAMGGVWARKGMRFQDLWLVHHLAAWVVDPLFRGFVNEGREDVDTFRYEDERRQKYDLERWQMKDRLVTRALLAEVLSGFEAQHKRRIADGHPPVSRFHLVAPAPHEDVWTLPDLIERVRHSRIAYGPDAPEYVTSLKDLRGRLKKLGVRADGSFVSERVHLDFRAGWAESSKHYWDTLEGLLKAVGVSPDRARDAANHLLVIVTGDVGQLVGRDTIIDTLKPFHGSAAPADTSAALPGRTGRASREQAPAASPGAGSQCLISYFPDESQLLQFPDGTRGLIDCGPAAIQHIVRYLSERSIDTLSFLALSHWHHTHYGGVPALLNAVTRIENVWLPTLHADASSVFARRASRNPRVVGPIGATARQAVDQLLERARRERTQVRFAPGLQWIHRAGRRADADFICGFAPSVEEYQFAADTFNSLSAAYLVRIAGRQLLLGGHAVAKRWQHVLETARAADVTISADGFVLPHYASRHSLTPELIKALVNPGPFVALLPVSETITRKFPNITDRKVLDAVRAARGHVVVCDGHEPMHFVMNREGLFQALTPVRS